MKTQHEGVSQSAQAAVTKLHRLGGLKNRYLLLKVMEAENERSVLPAWSDSWLADLCLLGMCSKIGVGGKKDKGKRGEKEERETHTSSCLTFITRIPIPTWGLHL